MPAENLPTVFVDGEDDAAPENWLSAAETIRLVRTVAFTQLAHVAICKRAHAGLIRARAQAILIGDRRDIDVAVPERFWWAEGNTALTQNWEVGDFSTFVDKRYEVKVFGVRFCREDIKKMIPDGFPDLPAPSPPLGTPREGGGRRMSDLWPEWVAELVTLIHAKGFPAGEGHQGSEELMTQVADRLAERGLEGPSRSTVQETAKAVLRRIRAPETDA